MKDTSRRINMKVDEYVGRGWQKVGVERGYDCNDLCTNMLSRRSMEQYDAPYILTIAAQMHICHGENVKYKYLLFCAIIC